MNERIRTILILIMVILVCVGGAWWWQSAKIPQRVDAPGGAVQPVDVPDTGKAPQVGEAIGSFTAIDIEGRRFSLAQLKGQPLWLTFGASWCTGCRTEAPDIEQAYQAHRSTGLQVVGVYVREDTSAAKTYADRVGLTFTQVPDPEATLATRYRALGVPLHYFVDRQGIVRDMVVGVLSRSHMEEKLAAITAR